MPFQKGTEFLIRVLETDTFAKDVPRTPALVLGALVGLERHARLGMASDLVAKASDAALKVLKQSTPPEDVSEEVHNWMRCKAAAVLANLHADEGGRMHDGLLTMIGDETVDLDDRCCVVESLSKIDYAKANVDAAAAAKVLVDLCVQVGKFEAKEARILQDEIVSGRFRAGMDDGPKFERRRLLGRLLPIKGGMNAVAAAMSPESQLQAEAIVAAIDGVIAAAEPKDSLDLELADQILNMSATFDAIAANWGNPEGAEDDGLEGDLDLGDVLEN